MKEKRKEKGKRIKRGRNERKEWIENRIKKGMDREQEKERNGQRI